MSTLSVNVPSYALAILVGLVAHAAPAATPTAYIDSATVVGTPNRINVVRLPVTDINGAVTYKDIVMDFTVSNTGVVSSLPPVITNSPVLITSGFVAGFYKDLQGNKYQLSGPSVVSGTNRTAWSLVLVNSPNAQASQMSMSWVTGSIAGHPDQGLINLDGITSTAFSWGTIGVNIVLSAYFPFSNWYNTYLIGANQVGNQLVLHFYYTRDNIEDGSVSLSLCTAAC